MLGLPDHWDFFQGHCVCQRDTATFVSVCKREKRAFSLLEIGTKNQTFSENLTSASWFLLIYLILAIKDLLNSEHQAGVKTEQMI